MKKIVLLNSLLFALFMSNAQEIKLGGGIDIATPVSSKFGDNAGAGFGLSGRIQVGFQDKFSVMGTVGALVFTKKENVTTRITAIPVQFGFKYALVDAAISKLYFSGEAGIHAMNEKTGNNSEGVSVFSYAPGIGIQIKNIDLSTRIQFMSEPFAGLRTNYFNIRLGYLFGI
ncbi:MAG: outer membrane beta-barrel protein [Cyclobacteriaceae bacterium]